MIAGRRLKAPADDRAVLSIPTPAEAVARAERGRGGEATTEVIAAAHAYLAEAGQPVPATQACGLIVTGHQPELAHPGVWIKNFIASQIAARTGRLALNLIADSDTAKATSLRVPVWDPDPAQVRSLAVPFDHFAGETPYEERVVLEPEVWDRFPGAVGEITDGWGYEPLFGRFWEAVTRHAARTPLIGERFSAARREIERDWGVTNLELPMSRVCRTAAFARFARSILGSAGPFRECYNRRVGEYRRLHGIRSRSHPVPDLERQGDRIEVPFWGWHPGSRRGRMFVSQDRSGLRLWIGGEAGPLMPPDESGFVDEWSGLEVPRIRPRALTTTMFARLGLADLFVHGIGGGKYDEVTDAIIADHFGVPPPGYLILSGTLHLPLSAGPIGAAEVASLARTERDLHWNPQRHLPPGVASSLIEEKRRRIEESPADREGRRARFHRLRELTERLRPEVADRARLARDGRESAEVRAGANAILKRRDYASVLFPEARLREWLTEERV